MDAAQGAEGGGTPPEYTDPSTSFKDMTTRFIETYKQTTLKMGFLLAFSRDFFKHTFPEQAVKINYYYPHLVIITRGLIRQDEFLSYDYRIKSAISIGGNYLAIAMQSLVTYLIAGHQFGYSCTQMEDKGLNCEDPRDLFNSPAVATLGLLVNVLVCVSFKHIMYNRCDFNKDKPFGNELYDNIKFKIGICYNTMLAIFTHPQTIIMYGHSLASIKDLALDIYTTTAASLINTFDDFLKTPIIANAVVIEQIITKTLWTTIMKAREEAMNVIDKY